MYDSGRPNLVLSANVWAIESPMGTIHDFFLVKITSNEKSGGEEVKDAPG
jgi:hypothetical protein